MRYKTFLDANIIMYALGKEHSLRNPCRKSLEMIKEGKRDAIHAATMFNNGVEKILSTNPHFDVIHGIQRIAPERL